MTATIAFAISHSDDTSVVRVGEADFADNRDSLLAALLHLAGWLGQPAASLVHAWLHFDERPPTELHACGDKLVLSTADPYGDTDMGEYGEIRVAPAAPPDLLAGVAGRRLTDAAVILESFYPSVCAGMLLRLDDVDVVVGTFCDEWILTVDQPPAHLAPYWRPQQWLMQD